MRQLLDDPEQAAERGRRLRERAVAKYSWDEAGRRIVGIYERVLAPHSLSLSTVEGHSSAEPKGLS